MSQRTSVKFKAKWPRLFWAKTKTQNDLKFYVDENFVIRVLPK